MTHREKIWAIIPARSGSKGYPGKNISHLAGIPLVAHSILFAKKLSFVDKIILSTDSEEYAEIGEKYGASIPFLRSKSAAEDFSMEEDILEDFVKQLREKNIQPPDSILWLRPTHPARDVEVFEKAHKKFLSNKFTSVCVVTPEDPRIFYPNQDLLKASIKNFDDRSMVRRQDCDPAYRIFHGEFFDIPSEWNRKFLGDRIGFEVMSKDCHFDIDYQEDIDYLNYILQTENGRKRYSKYLIV